MRIILLFFIWAIAIPAHSNPYENVWYRWNTFQDTVDEKAMYLRCGHILKSLKLENVYIHELKIIKLKNAKYELYELIDDNWQKIDAIIGDRKVKYKRNTSVTTYNIRDLGKFELNEMYVDLQNLTSSRFIEVDLGLELEEDKKQTSSRFIEVDLGLELPVNEEDEEESISNGFYIPEGQTSLGEKEEPVSQTFEEMQKKFNDRFEILNKIEKSITIDFSTGKLKTLKKPYNKNDKNINQALIYKDKIDSKILDASTELFVGLPKRLKYYVYNYKCLALKK